MKFFALTLLAVAMLISCSGKEKFVDNYQEENKALIAVNSSSGAYVKAVNLADATTLYDDIFAQVNSISAPDSISTMKMFRENIFIFFPNIKKIIVLNKDSFKIVAEVDFSNEGLIPTDICFANATDAYIAHSNSNKVSLLDLTNFQVARQITVGKYPTAITASGNQVYTANYGDNTVSVIDSRTNKQEAVISVAPNPSFIGTNSDGKEVLVVSIGTGKGDGNATSSPAIATFIDVASRSKLQETQIGTAATPAIYVVPQSLAISGKDYAFVSTATNFLRISMKSRTSFMNIGRFVYSQVVYNSYKKLLLAIATDENGNSQKVAVCNSITGAVLYHQPLPSGTQCLLPIY